MSKKLPPEFREQSGYNVRNVEIEAKLRTLARELNADMPEGWGFALLMFYYGKATRPGDALFYISSAQREDMVKAMREFIARNTQ